MPAGRSAIGFADLWALRHNDPGHRTDGVVIDRPKHKKAVPAKAEELAPPADRIAKPAKRGNRSAKKKTTTPAATVDCGGEMQTNAPRGTQLTDGRQEKEAKTTVHDGGDDKKAPAAPLRWGDEEESKYEEEEAEFIIVGGVRCRTAAPRATEEETSKEEEEPEFIMVGGVRCRTVAPPPRARKAAVAGGITVGGTNMRDRLRDNGPGHSADVVDVREHKKVTAAVKVEPEETPHTSSVTKKHDTAPAAIVVVDDGSKVQTDGAPENKQTTTVPDVEEEETPPTASDSVAKKHETAPAAIVDDGSKVQKNGAAEIKQATSVPDGEEEVTDGGEEKEKAAVSPSEEEEASSKQKEEAAEEEISKEGEKEEFIDVVTTVARRTGKAAVAGGIMVSGANMWAALRDDDPGHRAGGAKPAKRGKKTKKNKKRVAEDRKQADAVDDGVVQISNGHEEDETPADELPSKVEEEEEKTASAGAVATGGSRCRAVAGTICRAAIAAAALLALWCRRRSDA